MMRWRNLDKKTARRMFTILKELDVKQGPANYNIPYVFDVGPSAINVHARNKSNPRTPETPMTLYLEWADGIAFIDNRIGDSADSLVEIPGTEAVEFWDHILALVLNELRIHDGKIHALKADGGFVARPMEDLFTEWFKARYI